MVIWLLRGSTEVKHLLEMSHVKGTKKLKDVKYAQNWKPVEVRHNISNSEKVTESQF